MFDLNDRPRYRLAPLVALVAASLWTASAPAQDGAKGPKKPIEISPLAKELANALNTNGKTVVAMGTFVGPAQSNASAGSAIQFGLIEELKARGIAVKKKEAEWGIVGRYRLADDDKGAMGVEIEARIEDRVGTEFFSIKWNLSDEPSIVSLFGPTVALPLDKGEDARKKVLRESIVAPKANIKGTRVAAEKESPYAVEIALLKDDDSLTPPLTPVDDEGLAFVPIKRGQRYAVTLVNDSDEDAAVTVTIDGLNIFAFSKNKDYKHVILPKNSKGTIKGWHRTNEKSDSFLITELAKGAAAELGVSSGDVGTITASFAAAWPKDKRPPVADRPLLASRGAGNATARGPEIRAKFEEVERRVGSTRAVVSIRYDKAK